MIKLYLYDTCSDCSAAFAATIAVSIWRGWSMEMFGLEFPRVFDDATSLTLLTEPVHANHEFILYLFYVFVALWWYCVCSVAFAATIAVSMWRGWSMEMFGLEFPRVFDDATSLTLLTEPVHANHEFILYHFYVFVALRWYCVCSVAFAGTIGVSMWRGWSMEMFGLEFPRVFDDATSLTLLTEPVHANHEFILYHFYVFVALRWYCVCPVAFAATIGVSMWRGWSMEMFGLEFPRVFDDATSLTLLTEPVHANHEFILYHFYVFVALRWYCVCSVAFAATIAVSMWRGWSMEMFGLEFPRVFDDATSLTLLTEPVHANHEFILYHFYVFVALRWYCVCPVAFAATIGVSMWRGWSMEMFGLEFPRVFDDATSLTLLTEPVHANHEFILYHFYVFVALRWYCVCSVAFAATIAVSMWRGWSMEMFGLEFPRVFDDATSLTLLTEPVHANHEFILYHFYVFVALRWYCVCPVAFAATIGVSMWRGWSMELFRLEFPRVFDDAILYQFHSGQGLCCLIILWLVSFIWPGWRRWNPWNNCIAWPWMRPLAAPVSSTEVQAIFWMPGY